MSEDRILIQDLLVRGIVGVNDWERTQKQDIVLDIELAADLRACGRSDRLEDSVNYRSVTKAIVEHVESASRFTIEALAEDVARLCLRNAGVQRVGVRVSKPGALRFARSVGVEISRTREDFQ